MAVVEVGIGFRRWDSVGGSHTGRSRTPRVVLLVSWGNRENRQNFTQCLLAGAGSPPIAKRRLVLIHPLLAGLLSPLAGPARSPTGARNASRKRSLQSLTLLLCSQFQSQPLAASETSPALFPTPRSLFRLFLLVTWLNLPTPLPLQTLLLSSTTRSQRCRVRRGCRVLTVSNADGNLCSLK